jgi:hypothetical protein
MNARAAALREFLHRDAVRYASGYRHEPADLLPFLTLGEPKAATTLELLPTLMRRGSQGGAVLRVLIGAWLLIVSVEEHWGIRRTCAVAVLYPFGRGSAVADWDMLGRIVATLGTPAAVADSVGQQTAGQPNMPIGWCWEEYC